jgi:dethiobiotin synthase
VSTPKIFIAATHQNVGKTMLSLGILGKLQHSRKNIGYIKPVGQRTVESEQGTVDEDALLMETVFKTGAGLQDMNPVRVGKGFTAQYIKRGRGEELEEKIQKAYENVSQNRDFVVIEGTGHAGVGSVVGLSNARVAKLLKAPVVIVAPGGVGRPIDEVALSSELLRKEGVELAGVVINKVKMEKYDQIKELVVKGFKQRGIKVLGVLPYDDVLSAPTIKEVLEEIEGELIDSNLPEHALEVTVRHNLVGAMSVHQALNYFKTGSLIITPGDREDIILAAIGMALYKGESRPDMVAGIVLTGETMPHPVILDLIHRTRIPVITCNQDTYTVASRIHDLMVKICPLEQDKIEHAAMLVEQYLNLDEIYPGV